MNTLEPKYIKRGEGEHVKVLADNITIKVSSEETHGQFAVVETNNEAGAGVPPHYHTNEDEVFYIVEGEAEFMVHGKRLLPVLEIQFLAQETCHMRIHF